MPKKPVTRAKPARANSGTRQTERPVATSFRAGFDHGLEARRQRVHNFKNRRTHRSFRRTRRRDYRRSLTLPGYWSLTNYVRIILRQHRRLWALLVLVYALFFVVIGAITSQGDFQDISDLLHQSSDDLFGSGLGKLGQAGLLLVSTFGSMPSSLEPDQQVYLGLVMTIVWLATVWLLREQLLGRKPRLRDGLYNSAAPLVSTLAVIGVILLQLLPIGLLALVFSGFMQVGLLSAGFSIMIFSVFAALIVALVLYWLTSSLIALVIVTLPGMYPLRALRLASDLVYGRRLRILYRLLWGLALLAALWIVVMIPLVLLDSLVGSIWQEFQVVPLVPIAGALMMALSTVWYASYVYLFYRKLVESE